MTDRVDALPAPDGRCIVLRSRSDGDALRRILRRAGLRPRRLGTATGLGFADADRLDALEGLSVEWDPLARRMVDNRVRVRRRAADVARRIADVRSTEPETLRADFEKYDWADRLDVHQVRNVAALTVPDGWGACVFDEQGTGKTVTTIATFDVLFDRNEADVLLVVAPKSMVGEWATEFERFTGDLYRVAVADGRRREKAAAVDSGSDVLVANYEGAVALLENLVLLARRCRVVLVVDESYNVKNPAARRTEALARLREWCARAYVLCGTPAPNAAVDVVAQFDMVDFGLTFGAVELDRDRADSARQVREAMERRGVYVRNLKRQVLPDLPAKQFSEVRVDMEPQQQAAYAAALDDLVLDLTRTTDAEFGRHITSFLERRNALLRICSDPTPVVPGYSGVPAKLGALDEILTEYVERRGEKVVLWSFYRASLRRLSERYGRWGAVRIDGSVTDVAARREAIRRFQEDDDAMVFVGNPAAAGAGLTLHRARVAVYESLSNQAAHFLQSVDRIHRRGQEHDVEYVTLLCRGTIEEVEYRRILDKADAQADLLGDPSEPRPTRQLMLDDLVAARRLLEETRTA